MDILTTSVWAAVAALVLVRLAAEGRARRRRAALLAGWAHRDRLRFLLHVSPELLGRHECFDIGSAGHGIRLHNLAVGRIEDTRVRTFDLCFDLGRGLRRRSRRWAVMIAESSEPLPLLKMWTIDALQTLPLETGTPTRLGRWFYSGRSDLAAAVAEAPAAEKSSPTTVATSRHALMLCATAPGPDHVPAPGRVVRVLQALVQRKPPRISSRNVVENKAAS